MGKLSAQQGEIAFKQATIDKLTHEMAVLTSACPHSRQAASGSCCRIAGCQPPTETPRCAASSADQHLLKIFLHLYEIGRARSQDGMPVRLRISPHLFRFTSPGCAGDEGWLGFTWLSGPSLIP